MNVYTRTHTQALYGHERTLLMVASTCLLIAIISYMYFLSASVMHVVMRKELDRSYSDLSSRVGSLEAEYIEVQHAVSDDIASLHGFVQTDEKIFIDRTPGTLTLTTP